MNKEKNIQEKPLVKRILIEISSDEQGNEKVNFTTNNLSAFERIGLLQYYKELEQTNLFISNHKTQQTIK